MTQPTPASGRTLTAAERLAQNQQQRARSSRPMPSLKLARDGEPALLPGSRPKRSVARPAAINTPITEEAYELLERITQIMRKKHGRGWRQNATIEAALAALAREMNL